MRGASRAATTIAQQAQIDFQQANTTPYRSSQPTILPRPHQLNIDREGRKGGIQERKDSPRTPGGNHPSSSNPTFNPFLFSSLFFFLHDFFLSYAYTRLFFFVVMFSWLTYFTDRRRWGENRGDVARGALRTNKT